MSSKPEILLVDDNAADVKLALHALRKIGIPKTVVVVRDGEEALDFLFRQRGHADRPPLHSLKLILLDLKLPKLNGFEVLNAIKADTSTKSIPVVILTSSNQERDLRECYRLGANSYVQKPVDFDLFQKLVEQIEQYWLSVNHIPLIPADAEES